MTQRQSAPLQPTPVAPAQAVETKVEVPVIAQAKAEPKVLMPIVTATIPAKAEKVKALRNKRVKVPLSPWELEQKAKRDAANKIRWNMRRGAFSECHANPKDHSRRFLLGRAIAHMDAGDNFRRLTTDLDGDPHLDNDDFIVDPALIFGDNVEDENEGDDAEYEAGGDTIGSLPDHRRDYRFYGAKRKGRTLSWKCKGFAREQNKALRAKNRGNKSHTVGQQFSHGRRKGVNVFVSNQPAQNAERSRVQFATVLLLPRQAAA
ncbi:MAG: hypothetical protein Q8R25_04340 [bacterium]|nr:hypothetical protein [bacterium]